MATNKVYEIEKITDLLELDENQIDRICTELPDLLKKTKALRELFQVAGEVMGIDKDPIEMIKPLKWIDDGEQNIDIDLLCNGEKVTSVKIK